MGVVYWWTADPLSFVIAHLPLSVMDLAFLSILNLTLLVLKMLQLTITDRCTVTMALIWLNIHGKSLISFSITKGVAIGVALHVHI